MARLQISESAHLRGVTGRDIDDDNVDSAHQLVFDDGRIQNAIGLEREAFDLRIESEKSPPGAPPSAKSAPDSRLEHCRGVSMFELINPMVVSQFDLSPSPSSMLRVDLKLGRGTAAIRRNVVGMNCMFRSPTVTIGAMSDPLGSPA